MTNRSPLPDDVGAYCADVPDAVSLRDLARERAREAQYRLTADEALAELVAAFWRGEFDALRPSGAAFTLQRLAAQSREELDDDSWSPDTLARRAVYWTAPEYAAFVARFWYFEAEHPLPELSSDEERLRWLAALPLSQYPPAVLTLLERLHVSRASLPTTPPRTGRQKWFWPEVYERVLEWLDEEGEPETTAEVVRFIDEVLTQNGWSAANSTLFIHADKCLQEHRRRRRGQ